MDKRLMLGNEAIARGAWEAGVFRKLDAIVVPCTSYGKNPFEKCAKRTVFLDNLPDAGAGDMYPRVGAAVAHAESYF